MGDRNWTEKWSFFFLALAPLGALFSDGFGGTPFSLAQSHPGWSNPTFVDLSTVMDAPRDRGLIRRTSAAFAAVGLMEYLLRTELGEAIALSEEWAFTQGRSLVLQQRGRISEYYRGQDDLPGFAAVEAFSQNSVAASAWPYHIDPHPGGRVSYPLPRGLSFLRYRFEPQEIPLRNIGPTLLELHRPVVMSIWSFPGIDWDHRFKRRPPTEHERLTCLADQSNCLPETLLIVGYDVTRGEYVFRASQGPNWGNGGYGRISVQDLESNCLSCDIFASRWLGFPERFVRAIGAGFTAKLIEPNGTTPKATPRPLP